MTDTCLILAGGGAAAPALPLPDVDRVIAADGGLALAEVLGVTVDLIVGDLDSADPADVEAAEAAGAGVERHPADKDATDLELALDAALALGCGHTVIVGGSSIDRIDHLLANAHLVASERYASLGLEWRVGDARVVAVDGAADLEGAPGDTISIIPMGGPAVVTTRGLEWELDGDELLPDSSRGVSNRLVEASGSIRVARGRVLIVQGGESS